MEHPNTSFNRLMVQLWRCFGLALPFAIGLLPSLGIPNLKPLSVSSGPHFGVDGVSTQWPVTAISASGTNQQTFADPPIFETSNAPRIPIFPEENVRAHPETGHLMDRLFEKRKLEGG